MNFLVRVVDGQDTAIDLLAACLLLAAPRFFRGWGMGRAVLLPMTVYGASSLGCGWPVFTGALDRELDSHGYIRPGLGDAGDLIYGTR